MTVDRTMPCAPDNYPKIETKTHRQRGRIKAVTDKKPNTAAETNAALEAGIAELVERYRAAAGISQRELSKRADLGMGYINGLAVGGGKRSATIRSLSQIADALDRPIHTLIPGWEAAALSESLTSEIGPISEAIQRISGGEKLDLHRIDMPGPEGAQAGDLVLTLPEHRSGDHVAVRITAPDASSAIALRYLADPVLVGIDPDGSWTHHYTADPRVTILGRVLARLSAPAR